MTTLANTERQLEMTKITTERLELIAGTLDLARADIDDRAEFSKLLDAEIPPNWPPRLNDLDSQTWFLNYLERNPDGVGWISWYFIYIDTASGQRKAVGIGGFKGKPDANGIVEVGYSIMESHQRLGFGTEATRGLIKWAFQHPEVTRVIAETYPELTASIRVLEKNGFRFIGDGSEERVIRYELLRGTFEKKMPSSV